MCTTYEYNCRYTDDEDDSTTAPAKRATLERGRRKAGLAAAAAATSRSPANQSHEARGPRGAADGSSTESLTAMSGASLATTAPVGIFDEHKPMYAGASAAMAFPHILGMALGSDSPPKMHSFAYNFGIRPEEASSAHDLLGKLISEDDLGFFSDVYFSEMAPITDFMDSRIYARRCRDYYHGSGNAAVAFGGVAAGVAALGSFLSTNRHPREADLVEYAKSILDDPASMRMLSVEHIIAWGLRLLYLRATARPNSAWIASCTVMHLCEAVGLHEEENIQKMASVASAAALGHDAERLRRIFWIAWAGHHLLSYEYDRSAVRFRAVTCQAIVPMAGSVADQFVEMAQIIPAANSPFRLGCQPSSPSEELSERLKALNKLQIAHPFLVVTKADIAFCFYRRIYQLRAGMPDETIRLIVDIGNAAVEAAEQLASQGRLFWNAIGSVFHYACVLLAIDMPAASAHIAVAFSGLEKLAVTADTGPTREALSMARHLLSLKMEKKRRELAQLEAVEARYQFFQEHSEPEATAVLPDMGLGWDWNQFLLEPYLSMLGPDVQLRIAKMSKYARDQPGDFKNVLERVAIVGAGGTIGSHIVDSLLAAGRHKVTALSRKDSGNKLPEGVLVAPVDYDDEATLVAALKDQQFLIITMAPMAPPDTHSKLVQAAAKAGVPYVMPNGYGGDIVDSKLSQESMLGPVARAQRNEIEKLGMQWITVCCGFWYDYSLGGGEPRFGFDFDKRSLTIYDDGRTKNSTSTLSQVGRAVAKVLSLKELPYDENDKSLTLSRFLNNGVYVTSFVVSQNDMFESVKRVTGTVDAEWTITHETTKKRYEDGLAQVKAGNMAGFGKMLYARAFFPNDANDISRKAQNELLGLPDESLDEFTKAGIAMAKDLQSRAERMAA
ncbi:hypothetical protein O9K51_01022 [Purpureocillium lavendulum]|uniref:Isoflavone reductase family protein n=1 Tax=Purpureocillium lavendulum TaxID=1247861 RepID=A0AB34G5Q1_9HYPO|nr:hypothetical protein O9K51_01022 [Purpureocillium lavendulum]